MTLQFQPHETEKESIQCKQHAGIQRNYIKSKQQRFSKTCIARKGLDCFDEHSVDIHTVGNMSLTCSEYKAILFKGENMRELLCCSQGSIKLPPLKEPPEKLKNLLTGNTTKDRNFRENIRAYNSSLAFASLCLTGQEYKFKSKGPYYFRINGQVYHSISQMLPEEGKKPGFSQIYIYDQKNELEN